LNFRVLDLLIRNSKEPELHSLINFCTSDESDVSKEIETLLLLVKVTDEIMVMEMDIWIEICSRMDSSMLWVELLPTSQPQSLVCTSTV